MVGRKVGDAALTLREDRRLKCIKRTAYVTRTTRPLATRSPTHRSHSQSSLASYEFTRISDAVDTAVQSDKRCARTRTHTPREQPAHSSGEVVGDSGWRRSSHCRSRRCAEPAQNTLHRFLVAEASHCKVEPPRQLRVIQGLVWMIPFALNPASEHRTSDRLSTGRWGTW